MFEIAQAEIGDVLEFCDGEGFVSGTMLERKQKDIGNGFMLQVGPNRQWVHREDVVSILRKANE